MPTGKQYRAKAAEYSELLKTASLPNETREFRILEQSFITLAENDEWLTDNLGRTSGPGAESNRYDDVLIPRQEKNALDGGAVEPTQSTDIQAEIQQLFDDAGSKGGLLQTAILRVKIGRFLQKYEDDNLG
jgi:hypothetical protein